MVQVAESERFDLEFKSGLELNKKTEELAKDLSKDVSAMLNASGGVILLGVDEDKKTHTASGLSPVDPVAISKERLESIVLDNIHPKPRVTIYPVPLTGDHAGQVVYVVLIPAGETAHQAKDFRYYRRRNFRAEPMEDYEVREVMHRAQAPDLRLECQVQGARAPCTTALDLTAKLTGTDNPATATINVAWVAQNYSPTIVEYSKVDLYVGPGWQPITPSSGWVAEPGAEATIAGGGVSQTAFAFLHHAFRGHMPLWQDTPFNLGAPWQVAMQDRVGPEDAWFLSEISAPGLVKRRRLYQFTVRASQVTVSVGDV